MISARGGTAAHRSAAHTGDRDFRSAMDVASPSIHRPAQAMIRPSAGKEVACSSLQPGNGALRWQRPRLSVSIALNLLAERGAVQAEARLIVMNRAVQFQGSPLEVLSFHRSETCWSCCLLKHGNQPAVI